MPGFTDPTYNWFAQEFDSSVPMKVAMTTMRKKVFADWPGKDFEIRRARVAGGSKVKYVAAQDKTLDKDGAWPIGPCVEQRTEPMGTLGHPGIQYEVLYRARAPERFAKTQAA